MSKYKCIIFDCDGVLVDSETISNQVLVDMANELGANIDLSYALKSFKGHSIYGCCDKISKLVNQELPDDFIETYRTTSYELFKTNIKAVDGIKEVLENVNIPFCVASSGPISKIKLNLEHTGLLPYFKDNIFSCYTIEKWKPNPAIFLLAAETMGFNPNECLVVEDSVAGVTAAKNGGFDVFGFTEHDYYGELEAEATLTFDKMSNLLSLIN